MRSSVELGGGDGSCDDIHGPFDIDLGTSIDVSVTGSASVNVGGGTETAPPPPAPTPTLDPALAAKLAPVIRAAAMPAGRLGVAAAKVVSGQTSFAQRASTPLYQPPAPSSGKRPMLLTAEPEGMSTAKKVAIGVGALGTVAFLAWQVMR